MNVDMALLALGAYLLVINIVGLTVMAVDKKRAAHNEWRIPERTLFLVAILGGALGTTLGMFLFRHKTKHWYFRVGFPLILILWCIALALLFGSALG